MIRIWIPRVLDCIDNDEIEQARTVIVSPVKVDLKYVDSALFHVV